MRPDDAGGASAAVSSGDRRRQQRASGGSGPGGRAAWWVPDAPQEQLTTSHGDVTRRRFDSLYNVQASCETS